MQSSESLQPVGFLGADEREWTQNKMEVNRMKNIVFTILLLFDSYIWFNTQGKKENQISGRLVVQYTQRERG